MPLLIDDDTLGLIRAATEELGAAFDADATDSEIVGKAEELLCLTEGLPPAGQQTDSGRTAVREIDLLREAIDLGATDGAGDHAETIRTYLTPAVPDEDIDENDGTTLAGTRPVTNQEGATMPSSNPTQHRAMNNHGDERDVSVVHEGSVTKLIVRDPRRRRTSGLGATVTNLAVTPETAAAIGRELTGGAAPANEDHRASRLRRPRS